LMAPCTILVILMLGGLNLLGPRHSGSFAVALALPTVAVVFALILLSAPHLTLDHLKPVGPDLGKTWVAFCGVILALSGVEAIANLTGTLKPDKGSEPGHPKVGKASAKAILPVAIEVSAGTALLGWAMLSLPQSLAPRMAERKEDMLRFLGEHYAALCFGEPAGKAFGLVVGVVFALLLLSAVNTALAALIGLLFMMGREGDMPRVFTRLNSHGVPLVPLALAVALPVAVLVAAPDFEALAGLYAIGVVGAICVSLGSCVANSSLPIKPWERALMAATFLVLVAVEITLARTKHEALFFVVCVLVGGLSLWAYALRRAAAGVPAPRRRVGGKFAEGVVEAARIEASGTRRILVCVRGLTPTLGFALDEAEMRKAELLVLYVREEAILYPGPSPAAPANWKDDPEASAILATAQRLGQERGIPTTPLYACASQVGLLIADIAATFGADYVILGSSHRGSLTRMLRGDVVADVAASLPDNIHLLIHG
ncbi:MAG: amino acid permease, partial [Terrimicrobiaceae bacterium]|nr:amino acid permease [Terrimicrobiaceae bacterium]